ncbi:MAG: DUF1361 domain-containing protein [Treponema sp.]|nr:DUF1361 domain-containing protein [Treponema sp.]
MKSYFKELFSHKSTWVLLAISLFSIALSLCRRIMTGYTLYTFMIWNLFLAFIPWFASSIIYIKDVKRTLPLLALTMVWLPFFPNAPYILTDLLHLGNRNWRSAPTWFDLIMLLSYALAGLTYGFVSLQMMEEKIIRAKLKCKFAPVVSIVLIYISAFGVYIGRFLRWNSWDIVGNPSSLAQDILSRFLSPTQHPRTWAFTLLFGTLLNITYPIFKQDDLKLPQQ